MLNTKKRYIEKVFLKKDKRLFAISLSFLIGILVAFSLPVHALGDVRIVSHSSYYDSLNAFWIVGEVENTGDMATQFTKITATFYNSANQVIGTDYGYADLDILLHQKLVEVRIRLQSQSIKNK